MNAEKSLRENVLRSSTIFSFVKKFLRLLQNRVQATHLFLKGDDLGWGGEATRDAQGCGGGPSPLGLLELVPVFAQLSCWRIFCEHGGLEVQ